ncbi:HslU--HslV peptidase proteolytic subunit [Candidatus Poribacteria bacterium]|nr:MAG: HslU--HslV peptidase proteolytic subunit [Candidatus Poribacteria bacterium]
MYDSNDEKRIRSTTILAVRKNGQIAIGGDGQVTLGNTAIKHGAQKIRKIYQDRVLIGFAGSVSDALTLYENLEKKLEQYRGNLQKATVELARDWRSDRVLRRVDALMIALDEKDGYLISGTGDVIIPDDDVLSIGSGSPIALSAARALLKYSKLNAAEVVAEALRITSEICIYTNAQIEIESLETNE